MIGAPGGIGVNPVSSGMELAAQRLERYGLSFSMDVVQDTVGQAVTILQEEVGDRTAGFGAVEMFIENVTVGAFVRSMNDEASLSTEELREALKIFTLLLNSLWHFTCEF